MSRFPHVWSDGRRNPKHNSLPVCQLRAICSSVQELSVSSPSETKPNTVWFWMDTLCVPLHSQAARNKAITLMAKTYSEAEHVLVFSRELLQIPLPVTPHEAFVRIFLSKWMTRLWTLQEAALAKCLAFQFSDSCLKDTLFDDMIAV